MTPTVPHIRPGRAVAALSLGTLLNPLNSSMIAVALVSLQHDFKVDVATVTWVITTFYLASAAGQPLMGRLADRFGPRRLFLFGMSVVAIGCALTPFATSFVGVCIGRIALAVGTATAFPSAISMMRRISELSGIGTPRLLGRFQLANTIGSALGPVIGGLLLTGFGWQAIFWINIPLSLFAFLGVWLTAPRDTERESYPLTQTLRESDIPGIALFIATLTTLLIFLLDLTPVPLWWLLAVSIVLGALFVWRELHTPFPFINLRLLAANHRLIMVYVCFAIFNLIYYCAFFGLPQYLQEHGGYRADVVGVLMFPLAAVTIIVTPLAARALERFGVRRVLVVGASTLVVGVLVLSVAAFTTVPWMALVVTAALGIPYCVVSIAMNQALYSATEPENAGVAAGMFQTSRYIGAILATTLLGIMFTSGTTPTHWLVVVAVAAALSLVHLAVIAFVGRRTATA